MRGALVFGRTGQVARALARHWPQALFLGREAVDLTDAAACAAAIRHARPPVVLNAAAWTAVDGAESEPDAARRVNALAPEAMARACAELAIPFLHVSTDYVFDGGGTAPRAEDAATAPLGVYGATKREGEVLALAAHPRAAILRTAWVFSEHGQNFVRTMLRLGRERPVLRVVADQIGGPTPADAIAGALTAMAGTMLADPARPGGIWHFSGAPEVSWADFAREIMARAGLHAEVEDIPTADYPTPARRPLNSRLDCRAIARDFGISRPDWRTGLDRVLRHLEDTA